MNEKQVSVVLFIGIIAAAIALTSLGIGREGASLSPVEEVVYEERFDSPESLWEVYGNGNVEIDNKLGRSSLKITANGNDFAAFPQEFNINPYSNYYISLQGYAEASSGYVSFIVRCMDRNGNVVGQDVNLNTFTKSQMDYVRSLGDFYPINLDFEPMKNCGEEVRKVVLSAVWEGQLEGINPRGSFWIDDISLVRYVEDSVDVSINVVPKSYTYSVGDKIGVTGEFDFQVLSPSPETISESEVSVASKRSSDLDYNGYIVEFEEEPLIVRKNNLDRQGLSKKRINQEMYDYAKILKTSHAQRKNQVLGKIESLRGKKYSRNFDYEYTKVFNGIALDISDEEAEEIKKLPGIKNVHKDKKYKSLVRASAPEINANYAWDLGYTGEGVTIAIIDSGVDYTHPEFGGCTTEEFLSGDCEKVVGGYDFVYYLDGWSGEYRYPDNDPMDDEGHGTHVAATAAGNPSGELFYQEGDFVGWKENVLISNGDNDDFSGLLFVDSIFPSTVFMKDEDNTFIDVFLIDFEGSFEKDGTTYFIKKVDKKLSFTWGNGASPGNTGNYVSQIRKSGIMKGIAPDAKIYAYKVLDDVGYGDESWIVAGIERAIDPNDDGDISDHVDIFSMSLGSDCKGVYNLECGPEDILSKAVDRAVDQGIIVTIAAGNSGERGEGSIGSPGTSKNAITVGAFCKEGLSSSFCEEEGLAVFSSKGPVLWQVIPGYFQFMQKPDIIAPGVDVCAAKYLQHARYNEHGNCYDDKHVTLSGTSMATPQVAGAAALLLEKNPDLTPEQVKYILMNSATDFGYDINSQGSGRMDLKRALALLTPSEITNIGKVPFRSMGEIYIQKKEGNKWKDYVKVYDSSGELPVGETLRLDQLFEVKNIIVDGSWEKGNYRIYIALYGESGNNFISYSEFKVI